MRLDQILPLAERAGPRQGFIVIDVRMRGNVNQIPTAFEEFGPRIVGRLHHGPIAFHFTDRPDAEQTFRRTVEAMDAERGLITGTLTLVSGTETTEHVVE